jgi:hypothetical protein
MFDRPPRRTRTLGEEPRGVPIRGVAYARQREEVATALGRDVVDHRFTDQARLVDGELALEVLLEAVEQQANIEIAGLVEPVVVVVPASNDAALLARPGAWLALGSCC